MFLKYRLHGYNSIIKNRPTKITKKTRSENALPANLPRSCVTNFGIKFPSIGCSGKHHNQYFDLNFDINFDLNDNDNNADNGKKFDNSKNGWHLFQKISFIHKIMKSKK